MEWFNSFLYLLLISILAFPIGRLLPKAWFRYDGFPFRPFVFEREGKIYNRLHIRKWRVPDMSRWFPRILPKKELKENLLPEDIERLLTETCIAEIVHLTLCIAGIPCMALWNGSGGRIFFLLYVIVFQMPYILLQRYNRPRLAHLYGHMSRRQGECADPVPEGM